MALTTTPCQKYIYVENKKTENRKTATVNTDGLVVNKNGSFDESEWKIHQLTDNPKEVKKS